jgi:hypothetical protein
MPSSHGQDCDVQRCSNDIDATDTVLCTCQPAVDFASFVEDTRLLLLFCRTEITNC